MKQYAKREIHVLEEGKPLFGIVSIIPNIIAIAIFIGCYFYFIFSKGLFPDQAIYIYWTMKILVGYNIIAASARSFVATILAIGIGVLSLFTSSNYAINLMTSADAWQLIGIGIIGFLIALVLRSNH